MRTPGRDRHTRRKCTRLELRVGLLLLFRRRCLSGKASKSSSGRFRHMSWPLMLGMLPASVDEWMGLVDSRRERYGRPRRTDSRENVH